MSHIEANKSVMTLIYKIVYISETIVSFRPIFIKAFLLNMMCTHDVY